MSASPPSSLPKRFSSIPQNLRIEILYEDKDIIVINKPCNLRSVPGHADPPPSDGTKRVRMGLEAWVLSIQKLSEETNQDAADEPQKLIQNLNKLNNRSSIPRKMQTFIKFCLRSQRTLCGNIQEKDLSRVAKEAFQRIREAQVPLLGLPRPSPDEDSALGQLRLLGYESDPYVDPIRIVHRLDCETSGIMTFARNESSASTLSTYWRQKSILQEHQYDQDTDTNTPNSNHPTVHKFYLAKVPFWPPFHRLHFHSGKIDIPLAPHPTERIKWHALPLQDGGKPSLTVWRLYNPSWMEAQRTSSNMHLSDIQTTTTFDSITPPYNPKADHPIILELEPITGRTHQLRVHCRAVSGGFSIIGDSLYDSFAPSNTVDRKPNPNLTLNLHAYKLSFPHPKDKNRRMEFVCDAPWT